MIIPPVVFQAIASALASIFINKISDDNERGNKKETNNAELIELKIKQKEIDDKISSFNAMIEGYITDESLKNKLLIKGHELTKETYESRINILQHESSLLDNNKDYLNIKDGLSNLKNDDLEITDILKVLKG